MAESRISDINFYTIHGWMMNRLGLKGTALQVYAIIYSFSQDGESEFRGSLRYLCDFTGASKSTVMRALNDITDAGHVIKTENQVNGVKFCTYKATPVVSKLNQGGVKMTPGVVSELDQGGVKTTPNNKEDNKDTDNKDYINIVGYLNEKAGTNYRPENKKTQACIHARLEEGYKLEDFKTVIDKKCAEWMGGEMEKYLRPETLFGSKFENYLNAKIIKKGKGGRSEIVPDWMKKEQEDAEVEALKRMRAAMKKTAGNDPSVAARAEALREKLQ